MPTTSTTPENNQTTLLAKLKKAPLFQLIMVPVDILIPAEYNPRIITDEGYRNLKTSLEKDPEFMKARPLIVNTFSGREGIVIAGNQRLKAAKDLGWEKIPCVLVKVALDKEKAWNLKDNKSQGENEPAGLSEILSELHEEGFDLTSLGFNAQELVDIMDIEANEIVPQDDPEYHGTTPSKKPKVKLAEGVEIECPACHYKWKYGIAIETVDE